MLGRVFNAVATWFAFPRSRKKFHTCRECAPVGDDSLQVHILSGVRGTAPRVARFCFWLRRAMTQTALCVRSFRYHLYQGARSHQLQRRYTHAGNPRLLVSIHCRCKACRGLGGLYNHIKVTCVECKVSLLCSALRRSVKRYHAGVST